MTTYVRLADIEVRSRQRKLITAGPLNELKESILTSGLLHPPVCWQDSAANKWVLVVGERRLTALRKIHEEKRTFIHSGVEMFRGEDCIPITPLGEYLDEIGRFEAELAENIHRDELPWTDRMQAIAELHAMRQRANPSHTKTDTARELERKGAIAPVPGGGTNAQKVTQAVLIAEHLNNDKVANARNPAEAMTIIYAQQHEKAMAALIKRGLAMAQEKPKIEVRNDDLLSALPGMDDGIADLICADPPYGIGASGAGFRARTAVHHNYEDTVDSAQEIARCILTEGFRICKPRANLFLFCDIELFDWLKLHAAAAGWTPFKRPLIWIKSDSEGLAPWGGSGPRITTEFIFYATKGQRGLNASPTDVLRVNRVARNERVHAAEKPVELMAALVQCASLPGEFVLDPCCGSGSTLIAARNLGRTGLGIEKDPDYFNTALANVYGKAGGNPL